MQQNVQESIEIMLQIEDAKKQKVVMMIMERE